MSNDRPHLRRSRLDSARFDELLRKKARNDALKHLKDGTITHNNGKYIIKIPRLDLPHFRYANKNGTGVGQGDGEKGTPLQPGEYQSNKPGDQQGSHEIEVGLSLEDLVHILGTALQLPRLQTKSKGKITKLSTKYTTIARVGPQGLKHFKRTYKQALLRHLAFGDYDYDNPSILFTHDDMRYKAPKKVQVPTSQAVIFYIMDISGSMQEEQKSLVRRTCFGIDAWLDYHYKQLDRVYAVHDTAAWTVKREEFYRIKTDGGTKISSAFDLVNQNLGQSMRKKTYSPDEWNIYVYYFGDGDNTGDDNKKCTRIIDKLIPHVNQLAIGQVRGMGGLTGDFLKIIRDKYGQNGEKTPLHNLVTRGIQNDNDILPTIQKFLQKTT